MENQFTEAINATKDIAKAMKADPELATLTAEVSKQYLDAYIEAGFTRPEAIQMVAALTGKSN